MLSCSELAWGPPTKGKAEDGALLLQPELTISGGPERQKRCRLCPRLAMELLADEVTLSRSSRDKESFDDNEDSRSDDGEDHDISAPSDSSDCFSLPPFLQFFIP